jgi:hypothetical protein
MQEVSGSIPLGSTIFQIFCNYRILPPAGSGRAGFFAFAALSADI